MSTTPETRSHSALQTARREGLGVLGRCAALWAVLLATVAGLGLLITGPLAAGGFTEVEDDVNESLERSRTQLMDSVTDVFSRIGNTEVIIISCAVAALVVRWAVGRWREALFLVACVAGQALVFVLATFLVDRDRPDISKLDPAPPTSGYPSGHVGATTALYVGCAVLVLWTVHRRWVRVVVPLMCAVPPLLVAYGRLYRGMHHPSDVVVGVLLGLACVTVAWFVLLRGHPLDAEGGGDDPPGGASRPTEHAA